MTELGRGLNLVVIYTGELEACLEFYESIGLEFALERHGSGPEHHAAVLGGGAGAVLELYPARAGRVTGYLRLGLTVAGSPLAVGRHVLSDPDGRVVDVTVVGAEAGAEG